jgi:hypothetical protein
MRVDIFRIAVRIIASAAAFCTAVTGAAQGDTGPISLQMSLATPSTFSLGEPVVLQYRITNNTGQRQSVYMGKDAKSWLSERLVDQDGDSVAPLPDVAPSSPGGIHFNGPSIDTYYEGDAIVSQRFMIPRPGHYTLIVHATLTLGVHPPNPRQSADGLESDFVFPLTVTAAAPAKLAAVAQGYERMAVAYQSPQWHSWYVDALLSMPEEEAMPAWRTLANEPDPMFVIRGRVAEDLLRVNTPAAADVLAEMLSAPGLGSSASATIGHLLDEMYNAGSPTLRQHIASIAAAHGLSLLDKIPVPQVSD